MAFGTRGEFEELRTLAFGGISSSYAPVGAATEHRIRLVCFNNSTNQDILVSLNGVTDRLRVVANGFKLLDVSTNTDCSNALFLPIGTTFYIKDEGSAATSGKFWIETLYAAGGN